MQTQEKDSTPGLKTLARLEGYFGSIRHLAWSPDGKFLAANNNDGTLIIWAGEDFELFHVLEGETVAFAWSPDSEVIATVNRAGRISFVNTEGDLSGRIIRGTRSSQVYSLAWSPNGKYIASAAHDGSVRVLDLRSGRTTGLIPPRTTPALNVSWSPDSKIVASALHSIVYLTNYHTRKVIRNLSGHTDFVYRTLWWPDGKTLASASRDRTIKLWDAEDGRLLRVLEGHTEQVTCLSLSSDLQFLVSRSSDGNSKVWRCDSWEPVLSFYVEPCHNAMVSEIAFNPRGPKLASVIGADTKVAIWEIDSDYLLGQGIKEKTIDYINAKLILVGESGCGKSGLAIRLCEDEFRATESTHGARFWQLQPSKSVWKENPDLRDAQVELTVWDLAGQQEYRLVHQLFINDTDAALLLFDCSDLSNPFRGVPYWAKALNKHSPQSIKLLVASRGDVCPITVDLTEINGVLNKYRLHAYQPACAKTGEGVDGLMDRVVGNIPWTKLPRTTTPILFKMVRDILLKNKKTGIAVISMSTLKRRLAKKNETKQKLLQAQIDTVVALLQSQGFLYRLEPTPTTSHLLLKPELINSYASSIIQAARNHKDGLGSVAERDVIYGNIVFIGFERLETEEEKVVLESTVELLIKHDLCFRQMGLLIFPSQINVARPPLPPTETPRIEVTYQFSGSVEAIYASLVVRLSYTEYFHLEERWRFAAEFSRSGKRLGFIMHQMEEDVSELGIYFTPGTDDFDRITFIRFITDHLHTKGLDVRQHIRLYCSCGREITDREAINECVKEGKLDIPCQYCSNAVIIPKSIEELYRRNQSFANVQNKLAIAVGERTKKEVQDFQTDREEYTKTSADTRISILHISDIHLGDASSANKYRVQLDADLKKELGINKLDYMVISGDIANHSTKEEYEAAFSLIDGLVKRYGLDASRIITVPGNHDLNYTLAEDSYEFIPARRKPEHPVEGNYVMAGEAGILYRDDELYKKRFAHFNTHFYKRISGGIEYPEDYPSQGILHIFERDHLLFLALNSSWEIDHHFPERSSISMDSLSAALDKIMEGNYDGWLKIVVLHHPVSGSDMMKNVEFLEQLSVSGFTLYLHGHIHEATNSFHTYDKSRHFHTIAAGTFGAPVRGGTSSMPLQYNLLRVDREAFSVLVETRKKEKADGAWAADARWGDKNNPEPRYEIKLRN